MAPEPAPGVNVKLWKTQFDNGGRRGPHVTVMFVADVPGIYTGVSVKLQLLNAQQQAVGQLELPLPDIAPRQGLFHHVPVPAALADQTDSVRASLQITKAERQFVMLNQNQSEFKVVHEDAKHAIVQVKMHNANPTPVNNPSFVVESFFTDGTLQARYSGSLDLRIPSNGETSFLVNIPKPNQSTQTLGRF